MTSDTDPAAEVIADELLFLTGKAIAKGDFHAFKKHFLLPQVLETLDGEQVMRTEGDLRIVFDRVQAHMLEKGIKEIVRSVVNSEFIDSETVGTTHVSKAFAADGSVVGSPYPTYSVVRRTPDGWKIARTRTVFLENPAHEHSLTEQGRRQDLAP